MFDQPSGQIWTSARDLDHVGGQCARDFAVKDLVGKNLQRLWETPHWPVASSAIDGRHV
jgi:hypothetical protein